MSQAVSAADGGSDGYAAECRAQLARIVGSADFDATDRGRRFLSYIVDETLSGRGDRIKAYSIAVEVFGRDASFDPQSDSIVRIGASHLRRALEHYYLTTGLNDPILITIPKGGYVPSFSHRPLLTQPVVAPVPAIPAAVPQHRGKGRAFIVAAGLMCLTLAVVAWSVLPDTKPGVPERPRMLVQSFDDLTGTEASAAVTRGLSQEIIGKLSKFKEIVVVEAPDANAVRATPSPRFALAGSVNLTPDRFRLRVRLSRPSDGTVLWANDYDGAINVGELVQAQSDIASDVATTLAQSYGVISRADASAPAGGPPDDWEAYACTLSFYAYRADLNLNRLPAVRQCLEKAVARFPNYATAWGLLSQAYIDGVRFSFPFDPSTSAKSIELARSAAGRAIELDPLNVRGLQAYMFALFFSKDIDEALATGKRALAINPNDTELMGEYGYRLAQAGNWTEGCALVAEARDRNPGPSAYYDTALALCAYFSGRYDEAAILIRRAAALHNPNYHAIAAAIFAEAGHTEDAGRERAWLEANVPALIQNARLEVALRFVRQEDVDFFLASLRKAGLEIGS